MSTREVDQRRDAHKRAFIAPVPSFVDDAEESEDKVLTVAFKRGEKGAYQAIHDRYAQRVHNVCRRMLLHPEDAEEAAQESFLRVYQALGRFNGRYLLGPWITRVTTNVCLDQLRARGRRPVDLVPVEILDVQSHGDADLDPQEIHVRRTEGRRVHKLLETLPPMYRAAIVLRDFEGLSYAEVAAALEITEPQTKALIHRARQAFKRSWSSALLALPLRFVNRIRRLETSAREQGNQAASTVQHTGEILGTATQAASQCTTLLQHCGQLLAERGGALATVVALGTAGAAGVTATGNTAPAANPPAQVRVVTTEASADLTSLVGPKERKSPVAPKERPVTDEVPAEPAAPTPVVEPTPAVEEPVVEPVAGPTQAPPPATGGSGGQPTPAPTASPTPTPAPQPPEGFTLGFNVSQPWTGKACACVAPTKIESSNVGATSAGIERLDQVLSGSASAGGNATYGMWVDHQSPSGTGHYMDFRLYTPEGGYFYSASGTLVDRTLTGWNGWQYTYKGSYRLGSRPGGTTEQMTGAGTYTLVVRASWEQNRVVSADFSIVDGS